MDYTSYNANPNGYALQSTSSNPNPDPARQRTTSPYKTTARTSLTPGIARASQDRKAPEDLADISYNGRSLTSPSRQLSQRSQSPIKPSNGFPNQNVASTSTSPALQLLQSDSPTSSLRSPTKRPRSSLPPSSLPISSHEDMTIYPSTGGSTSKSVPTEIFEVPDSSDIDEDEMHENDENNPPGTGEDNDVTMRFDGDGDEGGDGSDDEEREGEAEDDDLGEGEEEEGQGEGMEGERVDTEDEEEDDDEDEDEDEDDTGSVDLGDDDGEPVYIGGDPTKSGLVKLEPGDSTEAGPSNITADGTEPGPDGEIVNALIPKKKRKIRAESELPDLPPPPPIVTIRLSHDLVLNGPTFEWDVLKSATELGLVMRRGGYEVADAAALAVPGPSGLEDGVGNGESSKMGSPMELSAEEQARLADERWGTGPVKKKSSKRKPIDYDATDPFIDDSEIQQDAPTHMARTVKEGFFVHEGKVDVLEVEQKPTKGRPSTVRKAPRSSQAGGIKKARARKPLFRLVADKEKKKGSAKTPIKVDSDEDDDGSEGGPSSPYLHTPSPEPEELPEPLPVDRSIYKNASKDPALLPPWPSFPKEVREQLMKLRQKSLEYNWLGSEKAKFPDSLRPAIFEVGVAAYQNGLFNFKEGVDEPFFYTLPSVLPYNCFTLTKLVVKSCYQEYCDFLDRCEVAGLAELKKLIDADAPGWKAAYEAAEIQYAEDKRKWDEEHPASAGYNFDTLTAPTDMNADPSNDPAEDGDNPPEGPPKEPIKKFLWSHEMKEVFTQLLDNLIMGCELNAKTENFRIKSDKVGKEYSENALRAVLYRKIVELFPEGYMNSSGVSREMSKIKAQKKAKSKPAAAAAAAATAP